MHEAFQVLGNKGSYLWSVPGTIHSYHSIIVSTLPLPNDVVAIWPHSTDEKTVTWKSKILLRVKQEQMTELEFNQVCMSPKPRPLPYFILSLRTQTVSTQGCLHRWPNCDGKATHCKLFSPLWLQSWWWGWSHPFLFTWTPLKEPVRDIFMISLQRLINCHSFLRNLFIKSKN